MGSITLFDFSTSCYFNMQTNRLIDTKNNKEIPITGQQRIVLRKLIEKYPETVEKGVLESEAVCDETRLRKVVQLLRRKHPSIEACLQNNRGEYLLVKPDTLEIGKKQEEHSTKEFPCVLQDMNILVKPNFVEDARKDIFDKLDDAFQQNRIAFLVGCGGIGKSEACKHWAIKKKKEGKYSKVIFAQLNSENENSNIMSLIIDNSIFVLTDGFTYQYEGESNEAYFYRKLTKIIQVTDKRTLIIIDNYDKEDPRMKELCEKGSYHLLVTTRNTPEDYVFQVIPVEEIRETEHLKKIFFGYLGGVRSDIQKDDPYIEKLFDLVSNHTLAIELIAKTLRFSDDTPKMLYLKMSSLENHELIRNVGGTINHRTPFEIIRMLFNISSLKNDENYPYITQVLSFMAAMPTKGIEQEMFDKWSSGKVRMARYSLVQKSWLREDSVNDVKFLSMHPLIREVVWHDLQPSPDKFPEIASKFVHDDDTYIDGLYHKPKEIKDQYEKIALSLLVAFPVHDLRYFDFHSKLLRILRTCANSKVSHPLAEKLKELLEASGQTNTWRYGFINYQIGMIYASLLRQRNKGVVYYEMAQNILEETSQTNEEKLWLALLYRDIGSTNCQDKYLFASQDPDYICAIETCLTKGEELVAGLLACGFTTKNLEIYRATLCVWRSKIAIYRGDLEVATSLLNEAEREFNQFDYTNVVDKAAVADVRASICAQNGHHEEEINYLKEANEAFLNGFNEYHYASVERLLKLATAYKKNGQFVEAKTVLIHCKTILEAMLQSGEELANETLTNETNRLLAEIS